MTSYLFMFFVIFPTFSYGMEHDLCMGMINNEQVCDTLAGTTSTVTKEFLSEIQNIILKKLGMEAAPNQSASISTEEKKYIENITKQIEKNNREKTYDGYQIDVLYPSIKPFRKGRRMIFWLPNCTGSTCNVVVARMRIVLRLDDNKKEKIELNIFTVNETGYINKHLTKKILRTKNGYTLLEEFQLDTEFQNMNSYTGRQGIAVICEVCRRHETTIARVAKRYGHQKSSLTILWKETTGFSVDHRSRSFILQEQLCISCCRIKRKIIRMKDLGWTHWVIFPSKFMFSFCHGECERHTTLTTDYSHLLSTLGRNSVTSTVDNVNVLTSACCVPQSYEDFILIFYHNDRIKKRRLKSLSAADCGCV